MTPATSVNQLAVGWIVFLICSIVLSLRTYVLFRSKKRVLAKGYGDIGIFLAYMISLSVLIQNTSAYARGPDSDTAQKV